MKLIDQSFEIIRQENPIKKLDDSVFSYHNKLLDCLYKHIEFCGRTCYKSLDKITEDSAPAFVKRMIASNHYAMLEHGTIYLFIKRNKDTLDCIKKYLINPYTKYKNINEDFFITTNYRVIIENHWEDDLKYMCLPTENHEKRITVKFICNRQVSHEFVRHRVFSFAQESTRYCNYSKDKFGGELQFIKPCWEMGEREKIIFSAFLIDSENYYLSLIVHGWKPQQAANVLPNALKTELIMTGFASDWKHFFDLRADGTTGKPHPQAEELAKPLKEEFIKYNYI